MAAMRRPLLHHSRGRHRTKIFELAAENEFEGPKARPPPIRSFTAVAREDFARVLTHSLELKLWPMRHIDRPQIGGVSLLADDQIAAVDSA